MKQPKFKFGDMVREIEEPRLIFTVKAIFQGDETFLYNHQLYGRVYREDALEPFEEPKQRKLYAYKMFQTINTDESYGCANGHRVRFFADVDIAGFNQGVNKWKRAPEYDIELPLTKASSAI